MKLNELNKKVISGELTELHTAYIREYVSRKTGAYVRPYKGRYGEGVAVLSPNWGSCRYSFITYYVREARK